MGILKAVFASLNTEAKDQWKEFFYCNSIPSELLMVCALKQASKQSANKGSDDIITDGSVIAVSDGQCAIVVSNGKIISVFRESGENIFRSGETFGAFSGSSIKQLGKEMGRRISFGGDMPAIKQRVYYLNTKEIPGIPFGIKAPFRIQDENLKLDIDCILEASGLFSFRVCEPEIVYKKLIGNVERVYGVSWFVSQMKAEVNGMILSAFKDFCERSVRPSELGDLIPQIETYVVEKANEKLRQLRGIEIVSLAFEKFCLIDEDMQMIKELQRNAVLTNLNMAAATLAGAQAEAMVSAAQNHSAGALLGLGMMRSVF